jgi:ABC-2 type transport system ATP-binding protein
MHAIETCDLVKSYGNTRALDGVTFSLETGRVVGLLGRNGAGKTTLLNIVANKLCATDGKALAFGEPVLENAAVQSKIFYMAERNLYPGGMRVRDAIRWTKVFYPGFDAVYAGALMRKFGLDPKKKVKELSTGYASILKAVLALASGAEILLFDEPVLGLDASHRALFHRELIARCAGKACTVIISTHLIDEVAEVLEEAVILHRGRMLLHDSVENLLRNAYSVSGEASAVDAFTEGRRVAAVETLGRFKSATLREEPDETARARARELKLDVSAATLQKLFIDLTND